MEEIPAQVPCKDCDRQFITEAEREKHMQQEHSLVPLFPCHLCGLAYPDKAQVDVHVKVSRFLLNCSNAMPGLSEAFLRSVRSLGCEYFRYSVHKS